MIQWCRLPAFGIQGTLSPEPQDTVSQVGRLQIIMRKMFRDNLRRWNDFQPTSLNLPIFITTHWIRLVLAPSKNLLSMRISTLSHNPMDLFLNNRNPYIPCEYYQVGNGCSWPADVKECCGDSRSGLYAYCAGSNGGQGVIARNRCPRDQVCRISGGCVVRHSKMMNWCSLAHHRDRNNHRNNHRYHRYQHPFRWVCYSLKKVNV